jgi:hypothetical protein
VAIAPPLGQAISKERMMHMDTDFGTDNHKTRVWQRCQASKIFIRKGDRVKLGRWSSWINSNRYWRHEKCTFLLILGYIGILNGWWQSIDDISALMPTILFKDCEDQPEVPPADAPIATSSSSSSSSTAASKATLAGGGVEGSGLASASAAVAVASACAASSSAAPLKPAVSTLTSANPDRDTRSIKESNEQVKKLRGKCANTLHFCATVLANFYGNAMTEVIDGATKCFSHFFDHARSVTKRLEGAEELYHRLTSGKAEGVILDAMFALEDPEVLSLIGFALPSDSQYVPEGQLEQEAALARNMFDLILSHSNHFYQTMLTYARCYPAMFLRCVKTSELECRAALALIKEDWTLLNQLERSALSNPWLRKVLMTLRWPFEQWCRELHVMFAELDWSEVSEEITKQLSEYMVGFFSTNINEDCFNKFRSRENVHSSGAFGRLSRWHVSSTTTLLSDYGKKPLQVSSAIESGNPQAATDALFSAKVSDFSLNYNLLDKLTETSTEWPHLAGSSMKMRGVIWSAIKYLEGNIDKMRRAWLSLVVSPGHLVHVAGADGQWQGSWGIS